MSLHSGTVARTWKILRSLTTCLHIVAGLHKNVIVANIMWRQWRGRRQVCLVLMLGSRFPGTRPELLDFPENRQVVFSGEDRRVQKMSLALEQPRLAPVQPWGCPRARDTLRTLQPSPEKTTCSFPSRFSGKSRNSGLVPGNRDPNSDGPTIFSEAI